MKQANREHIQPSKPTILTILSLKKKFADFLFEQETNNIVC